MDDFEWIPQYHTGPSPLEDLDNDEIRTLIDTRIQSERDHAFLCADCQGMLTSVKQQLDNDQSHEGDTHHNLRASASRGCQLCSMLVRETTPHGVHMGRFWSLGFRHNESLPECGHNAEVRDGYFCFAYPIGAGIAVDHIDLLSNSPLAYDMSLLRKIEVSQSASSSSTYTLPGDTANSFTSFFIAHQWLQNCAQTHSDCWVSFQDNRRLPSRLVDLGSTRSIEPRVCLTSKLPSDTKYTTLSHCWGGLRITSLNRGNLEDFSNRIPFRKLTKTFREAMEVTKRLGIQYIWIDSLCIVQDSEDEWSQESSRMADVYAGSFLNIAAASAVDGTYGCFGLRNPEDRKPWCDILPACTGAVPWRFFAINQESHKDLNGRFIEEQLIATPLWKRAWVLQELLLAPRVLYFCDGQLFWQCQQCRATENYVEQTESTNWDGYNEQKRLPKITPHGPPSIDQVQDWVSIIQRYTASQLTFPSKDKLAAVAGLAKRFGASEYYLAGLWKPFLGRQLLWVVKRGDVKVNTLNAPSWTWASIHAEVQSARLQSFRDHIRLLDDQVTTATDDRMGQVIRGYLHLEASIVEGKLVRFSDLHVQLYRFQHWDDLTDPFPCHLPGKKSSGVVHRPDWEKNRSIYVQWDEVQVFEEKDKFICLIVGTDDWSMKGLLVSPSRERGFYKRVGAFDVPYDSVASFCELCCKSETLLESRPELYHSKMPRPNDYPRPNFHEMRSPDLSKYLKPLDLPRFTLWLE